MQVNMKAFLISIFLSHCSAFTFNGVGNHKAHCNNINHANTRGSTSIFVSTLPEKNENIVVDINEDEEAMKTQDPMTFSKDVEYLENKDTKSYLDDGFIFGMEGSGIERPKGKVSQVVVEGDTTETQVCLTIMPSSVIVIASLTRKQ